MRRFVTLPAGLAAVASLLMVTSAWAFPNAPQAVPSNREPFCEVHAGACPDTWTQLSYEGGYVGHDEPAILFYSNRQGSGNSNDWRLRIPHESSILPTQDGTGGTWNFQQRITFWFGMALCETQSFPNPGLPCASNSDANIKDGSEPSAPDWIGNHVGSGLLELQFYPPGYVQQYSGFSCDATRWCAAVAIFGLSDSITQTNNADCLNRAGEEWANFAYLTRSG